MTPIHRGVWKGELSGAVGGGTRVYAITLHTTQLLNSAQQSTFFFCSWIAWTPILSPGECLESGFDFFCPMTHTTHAQATLTHQQNTTITFTKGTTHFDTHQMGCVEGRVVRRGGGRALTPTPPLNTSRTCNNQPRKLSSGKTCSTLL